jgi:hypothetical protein
MPNPSTPSTPPVAKDSQHLLLKDLWYRLSDDDRAYWKDLLASPTPAAEIRRQLADLHGIKLRFDHQLARFQRWEKQWQAACEETERLAEDDLLGRTLNPNTSRPAVRDACLLRTYRRAQVTGDFALGLNAIRHDLDIDRAALDLEKFQYDAAAAALKAWAKIKPIAESNLSWDEQIQELRRALFGSIPEDNPPAPSPAPPETLGDDPHGETSPSVQSVPTPSTPSTPPAPPPRAQPSPPPRVLPHVLPVAQPVAAPLNNSAPVSAPPLATQPVSAPPAIPSKPPAGSRGAKIAADGLTQAARMIEAADSLHQYWLALERHFDKSTEQLHAHKFHKLSLSTTKQMREEACALRDELLPLIDDPSLGPAAASWSATLARAVHVIAAADALLEQYRRLIDYRTGGAIFVRGEMSGGLPATGIQQLRQAAGELRDALQPLAAAAPSASPGIA